MTDAERQTLESIRSRIQQWNAHEVDEDSYYTLGIDRAATDAAILLDLLDEAIASANTDAAPEGTASAWIEQSVRSSERTNAECSSKPIARHRSGADYSRIAEIRALLDAGWYDADATFVANTPADIAWLLAETERLRLLLRAATGGDDA